MESCIRKSEELLGDHFLAKNELVTPEEFALRVEKGRLCPQPADRGTI